MALDPETLDQLLDTVRRFVRERLVPHEAEVAENDAVPPEIIAEMRDLGLFGLSIPNAHGGLGLSVSDEVRIVHELGWTSPAFRSVFGTNVGIGSQGIVIDGTDEQKTQWLPRLASGEIIASFALTEPEAGSDAGSLRTSARRDGDEYVLNGTKRYITNAPHAGIFTVMARTDPNTPGAHGVSAFIVERNSPGLSVGPHHRKMGQQGAHTADVVFEDCRVPAANLIGGVAGKGFKTAMKVLDRGRLHMGAIATGIAERLIDESVGYASERQQFGKPIGEFQLVQAMLADSRTEAYAGRTMVADAARRFDAGEDIVTEAACCKLFCTEMAGRVADRAVQIFGGAGYMAEYPIERFYRDVRLLRIYEGTSQIQQIVIARKMLRAAANR
ncbi:MAG: acyl-CoA dehydrogenase [Rhodospirillaceae bacterium]|nr:acyl-CoA dehydrogenase [Rhodospirillaceae bacterium]